jgi:hypothetical protein
MKVKNLKMSGNKILWLSILVLVLVSGSAYYAQSQPVLFDLEKWSNKLSSDKGEDYRGTIELLQLVQMQDSISIFSTLSLLDSRLPKANMYYKARVNCFRGLAKLHYKSYHDNSELIDITEQAINEAYSTKDKRFIAFITWLGGSLMINAQQLELAVTYKLRAEDIYSNIGYLDYNYIKNWCVIGELLFHTRDYEQSILYTRKALNEWSEKTAAANYQRVRYYNTIAQDYEQLNKLDSAIAYLDTSLTLAKNGKHNDWIGINSGFKGEVLFKMQEYQKAKPLLEYDYITNKDEIADIAAKSLQWIARINLLEGKKDSALLKSREAVELIKQTKHRYYLQPARYLEMCYSALAESFQANENPDSFYYYNQLYTKLHDSIQQVALQSSSRIVRLQIDNENILNVIQRLEEEKRNEAIKRNLIIVAIALLCVSVIFYIMYAKLKQRHKEETALHEKVVVEPELTSAMEQKPGENRDIITDLTHLTIHTDSDWENFKMMFEKIYPLFFTSLKVKAPNITIAEQRMAALTRLNLNSKQMAAMLGISVDSVHKAKQRLRQRLQLHDGMNLEETLSYL